MSTLCFKIPDAVREAARLSLHMRKQGFLGGTTTGWNRAKQLAYAKCLPIKDARIMSAWFARHGPTAANGGTSYRGYKGWMDAGRPTSDKAKKHSRGALAWLLWGGDPAHRWIWGKNVQRILEKYKANKKN